MTRFQLLSIVAAALCVWAAIFCLIAIVTQAHLFLWIAGGCAGGALLIAVGLVVDVVLTRE